FRPPRAAEPLHRLRPRSTSTSLDRRAPERLQSLPRAAARDPGTTPIAARRAAPDTTRRRTVESPCARSIGGFPGYQATILYRSVFLSAAVCARRQWPARCERPRRGRALAPLVGGHAGGCAE